MTQNVTSQIPIDIQSEQPNRQLPNYRQNRSMLTNAVSNWGPLGVNLIIGFVLTPYLISYLGKVNYGTWALAGSFIGYYGLLRLGVGSAVMRYTPYYIGRAQNDTASEVISSAMAVFLTAGGLILLLSVFVAEPIARFYNAGFEFVWLVRILGAAAAVECPMRVLDAAVRSHEKWVPANIITIVTSLLRAAGLAACIWLGYNLIAMGFVVLAVVVLSFVLMAGLFISSCHNIRLRPTKIKFQHLKLLLTFGVFTTTITLVTSMRLQGHKLIIGKVISLEAVAIYTIAVILIKNIRGLVIAPNRVLWPRFAYLDGRKMTRQITSLFLQGTKINAIFSAMLTLIILVVGPKLIHIWVGDGFAGVYPALMVLAVGVLIETSLTVTGMLLAATGHQNTQAVICLTEGLTGFGLSILLAKVFGLTGVAIGFLVSVILMRGLVCVLYICRLYNLSIIHYYTDSFLRPWLILILLTAAAYYSKINSFINGWTQLFSVVLILTAVYSICVFAFVLNSEKRKAILRYSARGFWLLYSKLAGRQTI